MFMRTIFLSLLVFSCVLPARPLCAADENGPLSVGNARFTVITPSLIRIEYSSAGTFEDAPSEFAVDRSVRCPDTQIERAEDSLTVRTSAFELRYRANGYALCKGNLEVDVFGDHDRVLSCWKPYAKDPFNLGGARLSLDQWKQAGKTDDGLLSRSGWFLLDDSHSFIWPDGTLQARANRKNTDWYLFAYGTDYAAAFQSLKVIGGAVPMPRACQLGSYYSRHWNYTQREFEQIVREYAAHGFPLDVLMLDMGWHLPGWTGYTWNRELIPEPRRLIDWCHSNGVAVALNDHPGDIRPQEDNYQSFMHAMGEDSLSETILPFRWQDPVYLGNYIQCMMNPLMEDGVDFWWLDGGSSVLNRLYFQNSINHQARGASLARWFGWGAHRYPIQFSGDASTSFEMLRFEIPFTVSSGNAGCFFWSHDIGGFVGDRNGEAYARWCQFGALSTALRVHSTNREDLDRRPWLYSAAEEESMRRSFLLRSQLFPYIYSSVRQVHEKNLPLLRGMYLAHAQKDAAYCQPQQYYFGDHFIAAPAVSEGAGPNRLARQAVWFPDGEWYNWFTGEKFAGEQEALVAADLNEIPLYVRGGAPIPMRLEPDAAHISSPLKDLLIRCFPGTEGRQVETVLYEDDGSSRGYESGAAAETRLVYERSADRIRVDIVPQGGTFAGQPEARGYVVELPCTGPASNVLVNGEKSVAEYDALKMLNTIRVPAQPVLKKTVVECTALDADFAAIARRAFAARAMLTNADLSRSMGELLDHALRTAETDVRKNALLAAAGIGAFAKNEQPTGYPNVVRKLKCYQNLGADVSVSYCPSVSDPVAARPQFSSLVHVDFRGRRFTFAGDPVQILWTEVPGNVAPDAEITAGSGDPSGVVDGRVIGRPEDVSGEWRADGALAESWIKLSWDKPIAVGKIILFGSPDGIAAHVTSGQVQFSDGSSTEFGDLLPYIDRKRPWDNSGLKQGVPLEFAPKNVEWINIKITGISERSKAAGLSEVVVLEPSAQKRYIAAGNAGPEK
jgi:alpha-glucosidase (family GH31 glycosyl hydrolase)